MKALLFRKSVSRYLLLKLFGSRWRGICSGAVSPVALCDLPEPCLPTQEWVRIAPKLAGICGSDVATLCAKGSAYLAPVTSMPFVMGHELVAVVTEVGRKVDRVAVGDRVVLHPALGCAVRGISPPCEACLSGREALCRNVTCGDIAGGIQTGYCRDTGGGFGERLVAHQSQVHKVPPDVDDTAAVLIEPFACALHAALCVSPGRDDKILVIGCGAIGLLTIVALRAVECRSRIVAVAKHDHQREHAVNLGADETIPAGGSTRRRYEAWAGSLDAEVLDPELGKPTVIGGADVTFDCVASSQSIDDGLRFTTSGGTFVLVGMPGIPSGVDWTPMWFKELTIRAAYAYGPERYAGRACDTFDVAIDLIRKWGPKLAKLVGPPHALTDYHAAFAAAIDTGHSRVVKTVFEINAG